jgi:hypothetical protein
MDITSCEECLLSQYCRSKLYDTERYCCYMKSSSEIKFDPAEVDYTMFQTTRHVHGHKEPNQKQWKYNKLLIVRANDGEKPHEYSKNMDNTKYFVWCIQTFKNYFTFFKQIDVYFEKLFVMFTCICELFRLLTAVQIPLLFSPPSSSHFCFMAQCLCISCAGSPVIKYCILRNTGSKVKFEDLENVTVLNILV